MSWVFAHVRESWGLVDDCGVHGCVLEMALRGQSWAAAEAEMWIVGVEESSAYEER